MIDRPAPLPEHLRCTPELVLDWVRQNLAMGNIIQATDPNGTILHIDENGDCHGGLTFYGSHDFHVVLKSESK